MNESSVIPRSDRLIDPERERVRDDVLLHLEVNIEFQALVVQLKNIFYFS